MLQLYCKINNKGVFKMIFGRGIDSLKRRKNKVYVYFANPDCPQKICEVYSSAEEAEKRKKELKKFGVYI